MNTNVKNHYIGLMTVLGLTFANRLYYCIHLTLFTRNLIHQNLIRHHTSSVNIKVIVKANLR
jgi:hypothetical protein